MALPKQPVDIPLGGGLADDVDPRVLPSPRVAKAVNVRLDKAGSYRKRRGFEAVSGTLLPADTSGVNSPFSYKGGLHLLTRQGVYAFDENNDEWAASRSIDTTPCELDNEHEIHQAQNLKHFDHAQDGTNRCEVWEEGGANPHIWFQIRDAASGVVTRSARVIGTDITAGPRVVAIESKFYIFGLSIPVAPSSTLGYHEYDPATDTLGAFVSYSTNVTAYDIHHPDGLTTAYVGLCDDGGGGGANRITRFEPGTPIANTLNLTDNTGRDAIAVWGEGLSLYVAVVDATPSVLGASSGSADVTLELILASSFLKVWQTSPAITVTDYGSRPRVTVCMLQDGRPFVAVSCTEYAQPIVAGVGVSGQFGKMEHAITTWRVFNASTGAAEEDPLVMPQTSIIGHAFRPDDMEPIVPCENFSRYGDYEKFDFGAGTGYAEDESIPYQRFAFLAGVDTETLSVGTQTGVETTSLGLFAVLLARFNGGASDVTQDTTYSQLGRAYLDDPANGGTKRWHFASAILREDRGRAWLQGGYRTVAGGRVMTFEFSPGPTRVLEINNSALMNLGYLSSFDGQVSGELAPLAAPDHLFISTSSITYGSPAFVQVGLAADTEVTLNFVVDLEVIDRAGNIHRTGPGLYVDRFEAQLKVAAGGSALTNAYNVDLTFTVPQLTHFRGQAGLGFRARVYYGQDDLPRRLVAVLPVTEVTAVHNNGAGFFVGLGRVSLDESFAVPGNETIAALGDLRVSEPNPYEFEAIPEKPPGFRDISTAAHLVFGISAENPSEVFISKAPRYGRGVEFNPAFNVYSTVAQFVAVAGMDEKVVLLAEEAVYIIPAQAPSDDGQGTPPDPQLLSTDTGCVNKRSVVGGPFGVIFQGRRGFYLVTRSLDVQYIGGPVEDQIDGEEVYTAVVVAEEQEVRFTTSTNNIMLVFHYTTGQWSTRRMNAFGACTVAGRYYISKDTASGYAVAAERTESDQDYADATQDAGGTQISNDMEIETAWIKLAGLQGFKRVYKALILGEYRKMGALIPAKITVQVAYDYDETWVDTRVWDSSYQTFGTATYGDPIQLEVRPSKSKCQAIKFRIIQEPADATELAPLVWTEGVIISGLTLEVGMKPGAYRFPGRRA